MENLERQIRARQIWLKTYEKLASISKAALRCGIARSTLYRWVKRYEKEGLSGLSDKLKRPKKLAKNKISKEIEDLILNLRKDRNWGAQRISIYLLRKNISLSTMTVWWVLSRQQVSPVVKRRKKADYIRYNKELPGERVQLNVTKLRNQAYQFT